MRTMSQQDAAEVYRKVYDMICDPNDPRGPIDCEVPFELAGVAHDAILFMTGSIPVADWSNRPKCRLAAAGYRNGPAGG